MHVEQVSTNVSWNLTKLEPDVSFLLLIAQGDRRAMHMLFARYRARVYRYALRLTKDDAVAQDLVNEVFLAVWRQSARFEGRSQVCTWLLAIAGNMAAAALKRRPLESVDQSLADSVPDLADDPEVATGKLQEKSILAACISKLSPHHREIINLIYYREKSITEVAEIIGVPRSTVKTRMFYARNEIAELLKEHGSEWARPRKALRTLCVVHWEISKRRRRDIERAGLLRPAPENRAFAV
jgi:RNA polymerase sigma-70 factor (ECF subfamily)